MTKHDKILLLLGAVALGGYCIWKHKSTTSNFVGQPVKPEVVALGTPTFGLNFGVPWNVINK